MTFEQKQQMPDLYRRLKRAVTAPGDTVWTAGLSERKPYAPVDRWRAS